MKNISKAKMNTQYSDKKCSFSFRLETGSDAISLRQGGTLFHSLIAVKEKLVGASATTLDKKKPCELLPRVRCPCTAEGGCSLGISLKRERDCSLGISLKRERDCSLGISLKRVGDSLRIFFKHFCESRIVKVSNFCGFHPILIQFGMGTNNGPKTTQNELVIATAIF